MQIPIHNYLMVFSLSDEQSQYALVILRRWEAKGYGQVKIDPQDWRVQILILRTIVRILQEGFCAHAHTIISLGYEKTDSHILNTTPIAVRRKKPLVFKQNTIMSESKHSEHPSSSLSSLQLFRLRNMPSGMSYFKGRYRLDNPQHVEGSEMRTYMRKIFECGSD